MVHRHPMSRFVPDMQLSCPASWRCGVLGRPGRRGQRCLMSDRNDEFRGSQWCALHDGSSTWHPGNGDAVPQLKKDPTMLNLLFLGTVLLKNSAAEPGTFAICFQWRPVFPGSGFDPMAKCLNCDPCHLQSSAPAPAPSWWRCPAWKKPQKHGPLWMASRWWKVHLWWFVTGMAEKKKKKKLLPCGKWSSCGQTC